MILNKFYPDALCGENIIQDFKPKFVFEKIAKRVWFLQSHPP